MFVIEINFINKIFNLTIRRISELNAINSELSSGAPGQNSLFDNHLQSSAPGNKPHGSYSMSPLVTGGLSEISRLREELQSKNAQLNKFEEQTVNWQKEVEERSHKVSWRSIRKQTKFYMIIV